MLQWKFKFYLIFKEQLSCIIQIYDEQILKNNIFHRILFGMLS